MNDINSKDTPVNLLKPAIENAFYIKEQKWIDPEYAGPEHKTRRYQEAAQIVAEYLTAYRKDPRYVEQPDDDQGVALKKALEKKVPLPTFARQDLQRLKVIFDMESDLRERSRRLKKKLKQQEGGHLGAGTSPKVKGASIGERNRRQELAAQQGARVVVGLLKQQRINPGTHTESQDALNNDALSNKQLK